jgi:GTP-binding protein
MIIKSAEFVISSADVHKCPDTHQPEYAFIGRSNVGKSSLINMLTDHKKLAKTSSLPGKTLLINHFIINKEWYMVDLPGYGYAQRSKKEQESLKRIIYSYIDEREQLVNLFLLIDVRLKPQAKDLDFMAWLGDHGVPFSIVFTKSDKLSASALSRNVAAYLNQLKDTWETLPPYFITSSEKGTGRDEILSYIEQINKSLT